MKKQILMIMAVALVSGGAAFANESAKKHTTEAPAATTETSNPDKVADAVNQAQAPAKEKKVAQKGHKKAAKKEKSQG